MATTDKRQNSLQQWSYTRKQGGTDTVKLSAKWLTALAAVALLVVALASLSNNKPASAATGTVFVANEWSKLTNESPAPTGYLNTASVYGTYGSATRLTETGSGLVRIVVVDSDLNTTSQIFNSGIAGYLAQIDTDLPGNNTTLTLSAASPIAGAASTIKIWNGTCSDAMTCGVLTNIAANNTVSVVIGFAGDGTIAPWISVTSNVNGAAITNVTIEYPTSAENTIASNVIAATATTGTVRVTSDVGAAQAFVHLKETGLNTGRFIGYVNIVPLTGADVNSTAPQDLLAAVRVNNGPLVVNYYDGATTTIRTAQVLLDFTSPVVTTTGPAHKLATQNRLPGFSGSVNETGSGLKLVQQVVGPPGSFALFVDVSDDPLNATAVLDATGVGLGGNNQGASVGSAVDGQSTFSFNHTPSATIPSIGAGVPDHIVDWQVRVSDLAGNMGFSDSDTTIATAPTDQGNTVVVAGAASANRVRIDQKIPAFRSGSTVPALALGDHTTGWSLDAANAEVADKTAVRVKFNDDVANVDASDFSVTLDAGSTNVPVSVQIKGSSVYLKLGSNIPANDTPLVALAGSITDLAGNATSTGSTGVADGIKPSLTITTSGGSGTGTGSESSTSLTKKNMTINISSDEGLSGVPTVDVYVLSGAADVSGLTVLSTGPTTWTATYDGTAFAAGSKAVVVIGSDLAASASPAAAGANTVTVGASTTKSFTLDKSITAPVTLPAGTTTQRKPFIQLNFAGDASSIVISEITLDGTNVTAKLVSSADKKNFFLVPGTDLSLASHTVKVATGKAADAAGNTNAADISFTFTVAARTDFSVAIVAGWQAVSFPSDPVVSSIDSVFSNSGIVQVVAYSGGVPSIATKDSVTGKFTSTTVPPLNTIQAGRGYWVQANNFESQKVALVGPVEPGAGSPPSIATIPVVAGWNFIGVTDASREQTQATHFGLGLMRGATPVTASDFFSGVNETRVYSYDPTGLRFDEVTGGAPVQIGDGLWVNIAPNADGSVLAIVP